MIETNATFEKPAAKNPKIFYSLKNKPSAIFDSSTREYTEVTPELNYKTLSDEKLVKLFLQDKDEEGFNEIVNRYDNEIYGLALKITRNNNDAEEVLQEVFLTILKKLDTFREESKFSTWLYRIAANESCMRLRVEKRKYENETSLRDYASYDDSGVLKGVQLKDWSDIPDEALLNREGVEIIEKALSDLPEPNRVVFHLRDIEGFSNKEVAEILSISITAVKSRIHRAR
ncbi:MAG: RNA polymerase sigma factor, partial [Thermodesulfobacteriota bacterium]